MVSVSRTAHKWAGKPCARVGRDTRLHPTGASVMILTSVSSSVFAVSGVRIQSAAITATAPRDTRKMAGTAKRTVCGYFAVHRTLSQPCLFVID